MTPGDHAYTWTLPTTNPTPRSAVAASFVITGTTGDTFADWIADPAFGIAPEDQGANDDPDGDGIANAVENFFGTNPGVFSLGLIAGTTSGNRFTFTHPQGTLAADLTQTYRWSTDLQSFHDDGETSGGATVSFSRAPDPVVPGTDTTVTATVTDTTVERLFVIVEVTQN